MRVLARSFWVGLIISSCLATVGGCSSNDEEPAHTDPNADPLAVALERDTGVVWNVTRDDHGRPSIVIPADKPRPLSKITQPSEVALEVFHRYAKLFGVTSDDAPIVTEVTDGPGEVQTVVLEQKVAGLRILHSGASVHVYPDGSLAWIEPTFHSNLKSVSTTPSLSTAFVHRSRKWVRLQLAGPVFSEQMQPWSLRTNVRLRHRRSLPAPRGRFHGDSDRRGRPRLRASKEQVG